MAQRLRIGEHEEHLWDFEELSVREFIAVKEATGLSVFAFHRGVREADPTAMLAAVWLCRRREQPELKLADVDFKLLDLTVANDEDPDVVVAEPEEAVGRPTSAASARPGSRGTKPKRSTSPKK